ncbi:response regulator [Flavobacterium hercynium]|uniref:Response regulator n=1 Tax=Flavobacterium hercynium TaxID=387094 RepID=A0A226H6R1_9FLAO|nr:response regulator [Flavobacterium hercynium]OXA89943.1 response regulator [Flavobacterium hercynium]SMP13868.1 Response regulator receiver domain-containing protein [Flavobacterium hercynium]
MNKKRILLADDDLDDTEMFCEALALIDNNIVCECANNGSDALNKLDALDFKPELIFLDLNMPVMNGWDCLKTLKKDKRYHNIPVIMISTSSHKKDMEAAANLGALCYFVKPNSFKDLKDVLHSITASLGADLKDAIANLQASPSASIFSFV